MEFPFQEQTEWLTSKVSQFTKRDFPFAEKEKRVFRIPCHGVSLDVQDIV